MIAFVGQQNFRNRRIARGGLDRNIELDRIKIPGKSQRLGNRHAIGGLALKYQGTLGFACEFKIGALHGVRQPGVIEWRRRLPAHAERQRHIFRRRDHFLERTIRSGAGAIMFELKAFQTRTMAGENGNVVIGFNLHISRRLARRYDRRRNLRRHCAGRGGSSARGRHSVGRWSGLCFFRGRRRNCRRRAIIAGNKFLVTDQDQDR